MRKKRAFVFPQSASATLSKANRAMSYAFYVLALNSI